MTLYCIDSVLPVLQAGLLRSHEKQFHRLWYRQRFVALWALNIRLPVYLLSYETPRGSPLLPGFFMAIGKIHSTRVPSPKFLWSKMNLIHSAFSLCTGLEGQFAFNRNLSSSYHQTQLEEVLHKLYPSCLGHIVKIHKDLDFVFWPAHQCSEKEIRFKMIEGIRHMCFRLPSF